MHILVYIVEESWKITGIRISPQQMGLAFRGNVGRAKSDFLLEGHDLSTIYTPTTKTTRPFISNTWDRLYE